MNGNFNATVLYCGLTPEITAVDFASCEFAYCSFVFAAITGFCIGAISLSNIIGVAYVNKKLTLKQLMYIAIIFEALGMLLISRYTLKQTVTKTINFNDVTNLRTGFITLGSTQMCSALIMINILIFALPMSTTQVVISGLAAITLIYLPNTSKDMSWFGFELLMWVSLPVVGLLLTNLSYNLVKKHIFQYGHARRRIMVLTPWYICFCSTIMFFMSLTKNLIQWNKNNSQINWWWYVMTMILFFFTSLIAARYYMLSRGRSLNKITLEHFAATFMKVQVSYTVRDICSAFQFWDNTPILNVYFDDPEVKEENKLLYNKLEAKENQIRNIEMFVVEDSSERSEVQRPTEIKASYLNLPEKEQELYLKKRHDQRIDKLFDIPLTMSICMLAMAHGSNEINVSAPLAAEIFMLTPLQTQIEATQEYIAILVGLVTVILGSVTLGVRYLDKFRSKFMKVTLSNGTISNTIVSLCLFFASFFGFTVSSTYILAPCLLLLSKKDRKKGINLYKAAQAVIFAISITLGSMFLSVGVSYVLLWLDYHGPYSNLSPYINLDPYQDFTT